MCDGRTQVRLAVVRFGAWAATTVLIVILGLSWERARAGLAPQAQTTAPAKTKTKAIVRFEMLPTNHMLVEAWVNDKGPYHLIFDLGAPITLLSNRAGEATGVVKADAPRSFLLGMRGEAEVNKLQAGELTTVKLPVIVLDHPVLKALGNLTRRRIDGIMGFTLFARYKTTIDYELHQMTFEPVDYQIRDVVKELPDRLIGPKVTHRRVLAPPGIWGLRLGELAGGLDSPGVRVVEVYQGSPTARAGLKPGDVLVTLDGRWTTSIEDVFAAAADVEPGREAAIVIRRDGKEQILNVRPTEGM
jgi:hypothetical protein